MKELKKDQDRIVLIADKGVGMVVMDKEIMKRSQKNC